MSVYMPAGFPVFKRWNHVALFSTIIYADASSSVGYYCKCYSTGHSLGIDFVIFKIPYSCLCSFPFDGKWMNDVFPHAQHSELEHCLWAFPGHNMSIVCCLSCSKYTALIHHRCLWYTCCTTDSKICLWIWVVWHTSTPRNCISALWSCLDRFTTSCNI
jgi:hypothetical protein